MIDALCFAASSVSSYLNRCFLTRLGGYESARRIFVTSIDSFDSPSMGSSTAVDNVSLARACLFASFSFDVD